MVASLQCYQCNAEYNYIGSGPHLGRCPACGSSCVPPAGELTVDDWSNWESPNGLQKVHIRALDERSRAFELKIAAHNAVGKLVEVEIEGTRITGVLNRDRPPFDIGSKITTALAQLGIDELEPTSKDSPETNR
jgi:hypothetical protein